MDFLDPKTERRNQFTLMLGYCLVALAIGGATLVLLYQAYGYGLNKKGEVTQNGLLFVSSQPSGSAIYLNGRRYQSNTNTRVTVPAGAYNMRIARSGYRDWQRPVYVAGGDVQHFDYPFLFPGTLQTSSLTELAAAPSMATQSPDHRWLLVDRPDTPGSFTLWDFKDPKQPVSSVVTLPDSAFTAGDGAQSWTVEEWASDNQHVVLVHTYMQKNATEHEYILLDRATPADSIDLTATLNLPQGETLSLFNNRIAQVYAYNPDDDSLQRLNIADGTLVSKLQHVLAFKTYADKEILYITDQPPGGKITPGQVSVVLQDGQQSYVLRTLPAGAPTYELNLAQYAGDWYIAVAASNDSSVYVYKDPQSQPATSPDTYPAPWRRLDITDPTYLSFSSNTQFLLAESGQNFVVYDLENIMQYRYTTTQSLDQPQVHAAWMDGDRLSYVSDGKLVVFDYDHRNVQMLMSSLPAYAPVFDRGYTHVYALAPSAKDANSTELTSTWLLTPADQ